MQDDEVRDRRRQARHPAKTKPEIVADKALVVWTWDITKLKGPKRGEYYDLLDKAGIPWSIRP